jgi:hypothetical protein
MWLASSISILLLGRKLRNTTMVKKNYTKPDNITLVGWVNKALN